MYSLVTIFLVVTIPPSHQYTERIMLDKVINASSASMRPVKNYHKPVVVTFGFELIHIVSIVESHQTITAKVWIRMSWFNEFIHWNKSSSKNVTRTRLNPHQVWTPDIYLQEDISSDMSLGTRKYKTLITIQSNGKHEWNVPTLLDISCIFDVLDFPFDHQSCTLTFTSWTHDQYELDIKADSRPIVTGNFINSSEWDLLAVDSKIETTKYECCQHPFVDISYTIRLRRKPLYYIYGVVIPCFIQMCIILFTFFLPPDSGERIGVVLTVLLVFAVYLEVLHSSLPKTSTSTPVLSRFYIITMAECACSLIATSFVLAIHFKGTEKGVGPMPDFFRHYFLNGASKYLGIKKYDRRYDDGVFTLVKSVNPNGSVAAASIYLKEKKETQDPSIVMKDLVDEIRIITSLIHDMNRQDEIEEEWQTLAKIFDRISFFIFLVIFVVSTLALLLPLYNHNGENMEKYRH